MMTAMPYISIFDSNNNPIMDPAYNRPIGMFVTGFRYTYEDEGPDTAEIIITTNNEELPSLSALQQGMVLALQWGWTTQEGPQPSEARRTTIKEHGIKWTATGVEFTIRCEDGSAVARTTLPKQFNSEKDFETYIIDLLEGRLPAVSILDYYNTPTDIETIAQKIE